MKFLAAAVLFVAAANSSHAQKVNADARLVEDFEGRVTAYVKMRKQIEGTLPAMKPTVSQGAIKHHEHELAERIHKARRGAVQGNIFTPEIAAEFHRLIGFAMSNLIGKKF